MSADAAIFLRYQAKLQQYHVYILQLKISECEQKRNERDALKIINRCRCQCIRTGMR